MAFSASDYDEINLSNNWSNEATLISLELNNLTWLLPKGFKCWPINNQDR